jgi:hypothetical protein
VLDNYVSAAQATYRAVQGQSLTKEQLRAGTERNTGADGHHQLTQ